VSEHVLDREIVGSLECKIVIQENVEGEDNRLLHPPIAIVHHLIIKNN
jgi:hypothetical protein